MQHTVDATKWNNRWNHGRRWKWKRNRQESIGSDQRHFTGGIFTNFHGSTWVGVILALTIAKFNENDIEKEPKINLSLQNDAVASNYGEIGTDSVVQTHDILPCTIPNAGRWWIVSIKCWKFLNYSELKSFT